MAPITVSLSGSTTGRGRKNVQTSAGVPYVLFSTGNQITIAKISGGSSADQDNAGRPPNTPVGFACAIDSQDIIHVAWWDSGNARYSHTTFDTSTDLWSGVIEIIQAQIFGTPNRQIVIAIDVNDDPHVGYNENTASGVVELRYSNRISGSWKTPVVETSEVTGGSIICGDIIIAIPTTAIGADRPIISYSISVLGRVRVTHGNALDATGFATRFDFSGGFLTSIATDPDNFVHLGYISSGLQYRTHDPADVWTTWSGVTLVDADSPSSEALRIATTGTDVHIISASGSGVDDDDVLLHSDTGSGFVTSVLQLAVALEFFGSISSKSSKYNNHNPTQLDYTFRNSFASDVFFDTTLVAGPINFTFGADAILTGTLDNDFLVDAILVGTQTDTSLVDAILIGTTNAAFSVDAIILGEGQDVFSVDALLQGVIDLDFTLDGFAAIMPSKNFEADALLQGSDTHGFDVDAVLVSRLTDESTADALVVPSPLLFSVDARVGGAVDEFTVDAIISIDTFESAFTVDADLRQFPRNRRCTFNDAILILRKTLDFTVDALLQEEATELEFVLDVLIFNTPGKIFEVDGLLLTEDKELDYTLDAFIRLQKTTAYTVDALIRLLITDTFEVDAQLSQTPDDTYLVDAFLQATFTDTILVDSILVNRETDTSTVDAVVVERFDDDSTVDSILIVRKDLEFTVDAFIRLQKTTAFTVDASIELLKTTTFTVDAGVELLSSDTSLVDAFLQADDNDFDYTVDGLLQEDDKETTFEVDAFVEQETDLDFVVDANVQNNPTRNYTVDAFLRALDQEFEFTLDSLLRLRRQIIAQVDAILSNTFLNPYTVDAHLRGVKTFDYSLDAILSGANLEEFDVDAIISSILTTDFTLDATLKLPSQTDFTVDAILNKVTEFTLDSLLRLKRNQAWLTDARLSTAKFNEFLVDGILPTGGNTLDFTVDACIDAELEEEFTVDAILTKVTDEDFTVDAIITLPTASPFTVDALLRKLFNENYSVDAIISAPGIFFWTADALLLAEIDEAFTVDAQLISGTNFPWTVDARLSIRIEEQFSVDAILDEAGLLFWTVDAVLFLDKSCALPDEDLNNVGLWTPTPLWQKLDTLGCNGVDFVSRTGEPDPLDSFEVGLEPLGQPPVLTDQVITISARSDNITDHVKVRGILKQSGIIKATTPYFDLELAFKFFKYTLTNAEASSITNYMTLSIEIETEHFGQLTDNFSIDGVLT